VLGAQTGRGKWSSETQGCSGRWSAIRG
jgi:hypothetical protein